MLGECKKAQSKAVVGFFLVIASAAVMYLGSKYQYGYLMTHTLLTVAIIVPLGMYGFYLLGAWLQCLTDYNNKHRF